MLQIIIFYSVLQVWMIFWVSFNLENKTDLQFKLIESLNKIEKPNSLIQYGFFFENDFEKCCRSLLKKVIC